MSLPQIPTVRTQGEISQLEQDRGESLGVAQLRRELVRGWQEWRGEEVAAEQGKREIMGGDGAERGRKEIVV